MQIFDALKGCDIDFQQGQILFWGLPF